MTSLVQMHNRSFPSAISGKMYLTQGICTVHTIAVE